MAGLRRICKLYGAMKINGTQYIWDYVNDEPVPESEIPVGSERRAASDKFRAEELRKAWSCDAEETARKLD